MNDKRPICWVVNLGLLPYVPACELQTRAVQARKAGAIPDVLLLCEHPHVITLGRNGKREHLRAGERLLAQMNVTFHPTDRGGDITYHGPGQIVGYPILDLAQHRRDVRWYVNQLEEMMIRASADFGVAARRIADRHGIWVDTAAGEEKLAALGVHLSRWVTSHGFAYNVSTDLRYFDLIVPCGIAGKRATSLERLLDRAVSSDEDSAETDFAFRPNIRPRDDFNLARRAGRKTDAACRRGYARLDAPERSPARSRSRGFAREQGMNQPLTREQHLDLYYFMQLNRQLEERMVRLFRQNKIVGGLYSSLGQEAVSVGTCLRARKARLDRAHDPQYRRAARQRRPAARHFHAAHGASTLRRRKAKTAPAISAT